MHAHEQEVNCPGCHKAFTRAGGLMSHIEYHECIILKPGLIEELRVNNPRNSGHFEAIKAATGWGRNDSAGSAQGGDSAGPSSAYITGFSAIAHVGVDAVALAESSGNNFSREPAPVEQSGGKQGVNRQALGKTSCSKIIQFLLTM